MDDSVARFEDDAQCRRDPGARRGWGTAGGTAGGAAAVRSRGARDGARADRRRAARTPQLTAPERRSGVNGELVRAGKPTFVTDDVPFGSTRSSASSAKRFS